MGDWTQQDQDRVVEQRRAFAAEMQKARREKQKCLAYVYNKLIGAMLWIEREGKRLMRGF